MQLERVIAALAPPAVAHPAPAEVRELAHEVRSVVPGTLFFCVPGSRVDGHGLAEEAVARGAVALVVERELPLPVPQLVVPSVRRAMPVAAATFFGHPSRELPVAAVTGTNGKTTTAYLLHAVLQAAGLRPGLLGNIERRVGGERRAATLNTPEAVDLQRTLREMLDAGNRSCSMEASSHAAVQHRLDEVRFAVLAFTNLSQDHLDFHGDMEAYYAAKRGLFLRAERPPAAVNVGDPWGRRLAGELRAAGHDALVTFGVAAEAELRPERVEASASGTRLRAGGIELTTSLRGRFNVENVLAAVAAARLLGVDDGAIAEGVASLPGVPGRLEPVAEGQPFAVLVDYAHTPDSLAAALAAARELAAGRVLCVFGCGGDRDRAKRPRMGAVAAGNADVAILTSDNPRSEDPAAIAADVLQGDTQARLEVELDRRRAIERAVREARPGDVVLIAGKGHEQGQEIGGAIRPFDDREAARSALRAAAGT